MSTVIPPVGTMRRMVLPRVAERTLPNGLRVIVARRGGVPLFEARLRVPVVRAGGAPAAHAQALLAETLLSGTPQRSSVEIAELLQSLGASLAAAGDADAIVLSGGALASAVQPFLDLVGEVLASASFPSGEVEIERERLAEDLVVAHTLPATIARDALAGRLYGRHAYGRPTPAPEQVAAVTPAALRRLCAERLAPAGSVCVLVGDLAPSAALDAAERALGGWSVPPSGPGHDAHRLAAPVAPELGSAVVLVERAGAVQTNIRLGGFAPARTNPDHPTAALANTVFGGYFSSRLVENIRERRGFSYGPGSTIDHRQVASAFVVAADVATEVTAAALVEIRYELARLATVPVEQTELDDARRYLIGRLAMSLQTQSGLAQYLATLAAHGLGIDYLRAFPAALARVRVQDVRDVAARHFGERQLVTVLVGDATSVMGQVAPLAEVTLVEGPSSRSAG